MTCDWFELPHDDKRQLFSANGVPYPLDEWLKLQNRMTTYQAAELARRWHLNRRIKDDNPMHEV